jgi:hypothetical protein
MISVPMLPSVYKNGKKKRNDHFYFYIYFFVLFRNDAEIYYIKSLRKTSDTLQKLAGKTKG